MAYAMILELSTRDEQQPFQGYICSKSSHWNDPLGKNGPSNGGSTGNRCPSPSHPGNCLDHCNVVPISGGRWRLQWEARDPVAGIPVRGF